MDSIATPTLTTSLHRFKPVAWVLMASLLGSLLWWMIHSFGSHQLGGYDHAVLVDTPYRLLQGQRPFQDFYLTTPPIFGSGAWLAFVLFGLSWASLLHLTAIFSIVTFFVQTTQFRNLGLSWQWALGMGFGSQAMTMVTGSYWWYNAISIVFAQLIICQTAILLNRPKHAGAWCVYCVLLVAVLLSKPNTAVLAVVASFAALCWKQATRRGLLYAGGLGLLAVPLVLIALRIDPWELFRAYRAIASRATPGFHRFSQDRGIEMSALFFFGTLVFGTASIHHLLRFAVTPKDEKIGWRSVTGALALGLSVLAFLWTGIGWVLLPGPLLVVALFRFSGSWVKDLQMPEMSWLLLGAGAVVIGLFSCFTNAEPQVVAYPLLVLPCFLHPYSQRPQRFLSVLLGVGAALGIILGWLRYRVELIGPNLFYQDSPEVQVDSRVAFFHGFHGSPAFAQAVADVRTLLEGASRTGKVPTVFFGPRMEWGYAAFQKPSPHRLPIWWDPGVSFPSDRTDEVIKQFQAQHFDLCIFYRADFTRIPVALRNWLFRTHIAEVHGSLLVLRRPEGVIKQ